MPDGEVDEFSSDGVVFGDVVVVRDGPLKGAYCFKTPAIGAQVTTDGAWPLRIGGTAQVTFPANIGIEPGGECAFYVSLFDALGNRSSGGFYITIY